VSCAFPHLPTREMLGPLLKAVAPNLDTYVITSGEQSATAKAIPYSWLGCTSNNLDLVAEDHLRERGDWTGRKPCFFIDDENIFRHAYEHLLGVTLHELGHVYTIGIDRRPSTPQRRECAQYCFAYATEKPDRHNDLPPFWEHGIEWIRRTLHLRYRAIHDAEVLIPLGFIINGDMYGLKHPMGEYWHYVLPECQRLHKAELWELSIHRPPQEFIDLWRDDVRAYQKSHELDVLGECICAEALAVYGD
jgi:hypothetical protein